MAQARNDRPSVRSVAALLVTALVVLSGTIRASASPTNGVPLVRVSQTSPLAGCTLVQAVHNDAPLTNNTVEPYVAVDPRTVGTSHLTFVGVWQQDRLNLGLALGLSAGSSVNGGRTWSTNALPFDSCSGGPSSFDRATDPWVSVGPDGVIYASGVVQGGANGRPFESAVLVSTSVDGGRTWGPAQVVGGRKGPDKASITADPYHPGTAYAIWDGADGDGTSQGAYNEWMSRTTDGGKTWSAPHAVFYGGSGAISGGDQILVDRRSGALYDFFGYNRPRYSALKRCITRATHRTCTTYQPTPGTGFFDLFTSYAISRDGGSNWSSPQLIARNLSAGSPEGEWIEPRNGRGLPAAASDQRHGAYYVVWQDARFHGNAYDGIAISSSHDSGKHWSRPAAVDPAGGARAFNPAIAVNSQGVVGVTYYTVSRWDPADPTWPASYWFVSSRDGVHFGRPVRVGGPFDIKAAPHYSMGDYEGLVAAGQVFHPFFVMGNPNGTTNPTDVFTTSIRPE